MSFSEAQREVDEWISRFEEGYWQPLSMLARISEEVGELARELNHRYGEKPKKAEERQSSVDEEIADPIFVLVALANSLEIDLDRAFAEVMAKYRQRDAERWTPRRDPGGNRQE
ncbi:MAG TPA: nucleotide pyrophosphohydrolase [Thermoanaerobaculia bacterium]|nr:nucleotide pyrophosphohydrolase [Thermoanaerobaculia bacterium]